GHAAREQADAAEDRNGQDLARGRAAETLAEIVEIGDHEDGEERRLRDDQTHHTDAPTRAHCRCLFREERAEERVRPNSGHRRFQQENDSVGDPCNAASLVTITSADSNSRHPELIRWRAEWISD